MSNTTGYINFSAYDYKNELSLSSYALPNTPFKFISEISGISNGKRVVWDFGDGTISKKLSVEKYYNFPGEYKVNLVVYDCNNNATISTVEKILTVHDYTPLTFDIEIPEHLINNTILEFECGKICGPLTAISKFPPYQSIVDVYYTVDNSNSKNYWDICDNKYDHLESFHTMYDRIYNYAISSYQYNEIDKIVNDTSNIFCKISNNNIVECNESDIDSFLVGKYSRKEIYFRDDTPKDELLISFNFDNTKLTIKNETLNYLNNLYVRLSCNVTDNVDIDRFSITSNGLDGEGYPISNFNIHNIKFFNSRIPITIKIKDSENYSIKNFEPLTFDDIAVSLSGKYLENIDDTAQLLEISVGDYEIYSINYLLSSRDNGGSLVGYIIFPSTSSYNILSDVTINITGTVINDQLSSYTIQGSSNNFNVYDQNYYDLYKMNENFDSSYQLKNLIFQETLIEKTKLFDDFFGSILGDSDIDHEDIGVKIYEKTANFVANTQDVDVCNTDYIESLSEMVGYNEQNEERYSYPNKVKRVMDLASLDKFKLIGERNKFSENFDIKGRSDKTVYGRNIGNEIDTNTYVCNLSTNIVALEKFGNSYTLLNTYQPLSVVNSTHYPLSSYSPMWGWPLVLPNDFVFSDIEKYYLFFESVSGYDNTNIGGIIDFGNNKTTIDEQLSNDQLFSDDGIFQHIFLDTLYDSLSLVKKKIADPSIDPVFYINPSGGPYSQSWSGDPFTSP